MPVSYAPEPIPDVDCKYQELFLAGSIEMGTAENWQAKVCQKLEDYYLIYNPRRLAFSGLNPVELRDQINWEQDRLKQSEFVLFYFDPNTKSPVSMLELGQTLERDQTLTVVCPDGFWRKDNIVTTCNRYGIPIYNDLENTIDRLCSIGMIYHNLIKREREQL